MKKKFLSSLLFAALIGGAMSTFTACKDYDDDISNLRSLIDKNTAAIEALQAKIDAGEVVTNVESTANGIKVTTNKGTYEILNGAKGDKGDTGAAGTPADIWKIGEDGYWYLNDKKTDYYALGTKGEQGTPGTSGTPGKDGGFYRPNTTDHVGYFDYVTYDAEGKEVVKKTDISYMATAEDAMSATWAEDVLTITNVAGGEGDNKAITINLKSKLKALVFEPDFYYQGIEALDFLTIKYTEKTVKGVSVDKDCSGAEFDPVEKDLFTMAPDMAATYHLNPNNAKVVEDKDAYSFIAYNKAYTRSKTENVSKSFKVYKAVVKDGYVTVNATYNGDVIKDIENDKQVTVLALQYKDAEQKDALITSDYAAVRADVRTNLVLNNPLYKPQHTNGAATETASHLFKTAKEAIDADAQIKVVWDSEGIDLREWVNTHYVEFKAGGNVNEEENCIAWDKNAAAGLVEKAGFQYSFELVGYMKGNNVTSQSAHAAINPENGYTLRPQLPNLENGTQAEYGADQNKSTIGREPLVRVILTDTINKKIAAVGYIKVKITEKDENPESTTIEWKSDSVYTITCNDDITVIKTKWYDIEKMILTKLNMSKETFEATYELDAKLTENNKKVANQFKDNEKGELRDPFIGVADETTVDVDGNMTEVLSWIVPDNVAYNAFKTEKKNTIETYIRYKSKNSTTGEPFFYVKLVWEPKDKYMDPTTKFGTDVRIKQYWYAADQYKAGTGYDDIHGNVEVPGTNTNNANEKCEFVFDIRNTLVGGELKVSPLAKEYAGLENDMGTTVEFADGTIAGTKLFAGEYNKVKGAGLYKEATHENLIATIDVTTGVISYNKDNAEALKLLNAYSGLTELDKAITAHLVVKSHICRGIDVPVAENTFNVKFLRPIDVNNAKCGPFEDAVDGGSKKELTMDFVDWRNYKFADHLDYYEYYGVEKVELNKDKATTNINGKNDDLLTKVAPNVDIEFIPTNKTTIQSTIKPAIKNRFGEIVIKNNGTTVGDYKIWIPGTVTYKWGKVDITVECTVAKTVANSVKK